MEKNNNKLYNAYSGLIKSSAQKNLAKDFLSKDDYIYLSEDIDLFFDVFDIVVKNNSASWLLDGLLNVDPEKQRDSNFTKKILSKVNGFDDILFCIKNFEDLNLKEDLNIVANLLINTKGSLWYYLEEYAKMDVSDLKKNQKLRYMVMKSPVFSLVWFDLEEPDNREIVIKSLKNDATGFFSLSENGKRDKEYILATLDGAFNYSTKTVKDFYDALDSKYKIDEDVCKKLLEKKFDSFVPEVFSPEFLKEFLLKHFTHTSTRLYLNGLDSKIPEGVFSKNENLKVLIDFMVEKKHSLKNDKTNYEHFHNAMRKFSKENPYLKERLKNSNVWRLGTLAEVNNFSSTVFVDFFGEKTKKIKEELDIRLKFENLDATLSTTEPIKKKMKI